MTDEAKRWLTVVEMMTEAIDRRDTKIAELQADLTHDNDLVSQLRIALQNIAGMALDQFPQLAQAYHRDQDPYELIRQCFLALRPADKRTSGPNPASGLDSNKKD